MGRLTVANVRALKDPGRYADGQCLYLYITPSGTKNWIARVQRDGKQRDIGLGAVDLVTLAEAREKCRTVRLQVKAGLDPVYERNKTRGIPSFREAAVDFIVRNKQTWKNEKHRAQWLATLESYAFPKIGNMSVDQITSPIVRDLLLDIWLEIPETARRVRQRIGAVIDWSVEAGHRETPLLLPSAGKGLPKQSRKKNHHAALPYEQLPAFMKALRTGDSISRKALEFTILTAARSGEVRGATWQEIDWANAVWVIQGERMKAGATHRVPLAPQTLGLLRSVHYPEAKPQNLIFEGLKKKPLSDASLAKVLKLMEVPVTPHGFRSTFRDWVGEQTDYKSELPEKALAHTVKNATEAAYQRADMLELRRPMMLDWANYADGAYRQNKAVEQTLDA